MKIAGLFFFLIFGLFTLFQQVVQPQKKAASSVIQIFLVKEDSTVEHRCNESMWSNGIHVFDLEDEPVIKDDEIKGYDWSKHELLLNASGYRKIPTSFSASGRDFIVVVNGLHVLAGTFGTSRSSNALNWPTILVNKLAQNPRAADLDDNGKFRVPLLRNYHGIDEFDHRNSVQLKQAFAQSNRLLK